MGCVSSKKKQGMLPIYISLPGEQSNPDPASASQTTELTFNRLQFQLQVVSSELISSKTAVSYAYHRPPLWYFTCPEQIRLVELQPTDPEYISVASKFNQTTPNQITRIRVVQNKSLYTKFAAKHDEMSKTLGRSATIMRLFHGTRLNDPKVIYESQLGLDSSMGGTRGNVGTFYAFNSNYSAANYAHTAADGTKEMFLCEVIVENHPPMQNTLQATLNPYSYIQQSGVWITYQPMMNYPYFLISYR